MEIDFKTDDLPRPLAPNISLCLFRVLQEALHNSANTAGFGTSKCDCGERRMRSISRLAIPAQALIAKRQKRAEGSASSAWRSG